MIHKARQPVRAIFDNMSCSHIGDTRGVRPAVSVYDSNSAITGVGNMGDPGGVIGVPEVALLMIDTFFSLEWDLVGESINGTRDIWIAEEGYLPILWWQRQ